MGFNNPINDSGAVTGGSNISTPDPNGEDFCGIGSTFLCQPFVWEKGVMTALPLLGGIVMRDVEQIHGAQTSAET